jgi:hypothetical protein
MPRILLISLTAISLSSLTLALLNLKTVRLQSELINDLRSELNEPQFESLHAKSIQVESITVVDVNSSPRVAINASEEGALIALKDSKGLPRVEISQKGEFNSIQLASNDDTKSFITIGENDSEWAPMFFVGWLESSEGYDWVSDDWVSGNFLSLSDTLNNFALQAWASMKDAQAFFQVGNQSSIFQVYAVDENCYFGVRDQKADIDTIKLQYEGGSSSFIATSPDPFNTLTVLGNVDGNHGLQIIQPEVSGDKSTNTFIGYGQTANPYEAILRTTKLGDVTSYFNLSKSEE